MRRLTWILSMIGLLASVVMPAVSPVYAADYTAAINIDTSDAVQYHSGFRGVNNEPQRTAIKFNDDDFVNAALDYGRIGFVRWPGGTPTNGFSWKLGIVDAEFTGQTQKEDRRYYNQLNAGRYSQAKGFEQISDYREFLQQTGAKAMIMVNVFQYNPEQARDLARYLYHNHVPVQFFELGNEVSFYVDESGNQQPVYKTGTDYLDRVKVFNDVIKHEYPGAKTIISMSNWQVASFDNDVINYPNPYWDGITTHRFRGDGGTTIAALKDANSYLAEWDSFINNNYVSKFNNPQIYIGEHGVTLGGLLSSTQYHGIYVSESILRLVDHPNISYLAGYRDYNGLYTVTNDHLTELEDAYQNGTTVDTTTLDFDPYYSAPSVSLKVVDGAVNQSTTAWGTTVSGGATVSKRNGTTMPAIFAQSFKGDNGKNYVVITNKSDQSHDVTIKLDGVTVSNQMMKVYTTNTNPLARNSATTPALISEQIEATNNPVFIPPYSVMRVEWERTAQVPPPQSAWLMFADAENGAVSLKWQPSLNATGYKVKLGTTAGNYTQTIDVGNILAKTVAGLTNGTTYYIAIVPYNSSGDGAISNEVHVRLAVPASPMSRRAYAEQFGNIAVEWQDVEGATGYRLKYGTAPGNYTHSIDVGNNLGYLVSGLTPNTTYYFAIAAYNGLGESVNSTEMSAAAKSWLPLAPHDAQITSEGSTSITISWKPTRTNTYREYFEDGVANGWNEDIGDWSVVEDTARGVSFYQSRLDYTALSIFANSAVGDYEGEAMIEKVATPGGRSAYAYGVVARYTDNQNYYKFVYNINEDRFKLVKIANGTSTVLQSKTRDQILNEKNANQLDLTRLHMYIKVEGNQIVGSINQLGPVLSATDSTHSTGKFGFYTLNVQANYDWARIYKDNADSYTVYRSTRPYTDFSPVADGITGTSYTDSNLTPGTVYYYMVKAVNGNGESYHHSNVLRKN